MTDVPTLTFAGGQLSRSLWGRVDLDKYQTGVKLAKNMTVVVEGGLRKRVGQYYVGKPKSQSTIAVLIPWRIADDDSYVLVFGHNYIRFIRFGGFVSIPPGFVHDPANEAITVDDVMELTTTYTSAEVKQIKVTFANDIMYIFHKNHQPAKLTRIGLYDWKLEDIAFNPHQAAPTDLAIAWQKYDRSTATWVASTWASNPVLATGYEPSKVDNYYKVSAIMADGLETLASTEVLCVSDVRDRHLRNRLTWTAKAGAEEYRIYKGDNGIYGFIGSVKAPDTSFDDSNIAPSFDLVPIEEFEGFGTSWPRVGEFYKQRMAYAATNEETQKMWISRPLFFDALSRSIPAQEDDAVEFTLVGNSRHTINHMIQLKKFLIFTDSGEWILGTTGDQALSIATADPIIETSYGSNPNLAPFVIGDRIVFVQNVTNNILDMGYELTNDAYKADDLSRLARDLFKGTSIVSWTYSEHPNNILPCVCANGTLPILTYSREHQIWGWSHNETVGRYIDTASVVEGNQHAIYYQVVRKINGVETIFIERAEELFTSRPEEMFFVDCGLTYSDQRAFTDLIRDSDTQIRVTCVDHGLALAAVVQIETDEFTLKFSVTNIDGDILTLAAEYDLLIPEDLTDFNGILLVCTTTFTGWDHLANQTGLVALADGMVIEDVSIGADGSWEIPFMAARVHCGFPYEGRVQTLGLDVAQLQGKYPDKAVTKIKINLDNSRGVLVGAAAATTRDLIEIPPRADELMNEANRPLDGLYEIPAHVAWGPTAEIIVSAPYPLPCHVLNIIPDLNYDS